MKVDRTTLAVSVACPLIGSSVLLLDHLLRTLLGSPWSTSIAVWGTVGALEWLLFAPLVMLLARRTRSIAVHAIAALCISAAHSALYFSLYRLFTGRFDPAGDTFTAAWFARIHTHLTLDFLIYGGLVAAVHAVRSIGETNRRAAEALAIEQRLAQAELDVLNMQLQPALIDETLRALEVLIAHDRVKAEKLLGRFSTFLRRSLGASSPRALAQELAFASAYGELLRLLSPGAPRIEIDVDPRSAEVVVPAAWIVTMLHAMADASARRGIEDATIRVSVAPCGTGASAVPHRVSLHAPPEILLDPDVRHVASEVRATLADGAVEKTHVPVADSTEVHVESIEHAHKPLSTFAKIALLLLAMPAVTLVLNSFVVVRSLLRGEPIRWQAVIENVSISSMAWPVTLLVAWLATRMRWTSGASWKRSLAILGVVAATAPVVWDLAFAMLLGESPREYLLGGSNIVDFLIFFGIALAAVAFDRYTAARKHALDVAELDARLLRTRAEILRLQLNPHFLFNALNSVAALLDGSAAAARAVVLQLRRFFERVLRTSDAAEVTLREELELLLAYLQIEKVRFAERLTIDIAVDDAAREALVPSLVLQPLVENAVRHGVTPLGGGTVSVAARVDGDDLHLEVRDNGSPTAAQPGHGIGLWNTRARLQRLYRGRFSLDALREADGFRVSLVVPLRYAKV